MKHAKTAGRETNAVEHRCMCGGVVKMVDVFKGGKIHHVARCVKCGEERCKPNQFV